MTAPIKGCPQPDAPELVMRANGYPYRTEDEMNEKRELTPIKPYNHPDFIGGILWSATELREIERYRREAIDADRALNAPPAENFYPNGIAHLAPPISFNAAQLLAALELANPDGPGDAEQMESEVSIQFKLAGKDTDGEDAPEGWYAWLTEYPEEGSLFLDPKPPRQMTSDRALNADAGVMREAPKGWKWVPIEPTPEMIAAMAVQESSGQINGVSTIGMAGAELAYEAMLASAPTPTAEQPTLQLPKGLHPNTAHLVKRFAEELAEKLREAEIKYGYTNGWQEKGWMDECRAKLMQHIAKGDPLDVAAYCAFLWHHGESTTPPAEQQGEQGPVCWVTGIVWRVRQTEQISKLTKNQQTEYGFNTPLYTHPDNRLAALRAKVKGLPRSRFEIHGLWTVPLDAALAEIDKMMGGQR